MECFCRLEFKMLKDLTVRWLIEKKTLLEEKNLFSLLRVYKLVMFLSRLHNIHNSGGGGGGGGNFHLKVGGAKKQWQCW